MSLHYIWRPPNSPFLFLFEVCVHESTIGWKSIIIVQIIYLRIRPVCLTHSTICMHCFLVFRCNDMIKIGSLMNKFQTMVKQHPIMLAVVVCFVIFYKNFEVQRSTKRFLLISHRIHCFWVVIAFMLLHQAFSSIFVDKSDLVSPCSVWVLK